ncbi:hypothetical protein [uncultured Reyranella sp.]|uniref:hypothetical protein n=1 Tax=uncultured Reyranella sp. TaxID=735512 RepID=UPI0025D0E328|nr:hypothetical protein [uncultured Reyranella sp.]
MLDIQASAPALLLECKMDEIARRALDKNDSEELHESQRPYLHNSGRDPLVCQNYVFDPEQPQPIPVNILAIPLCQGTGRRSPERIL